MPRFRTTKERSQRDPGYRRRKKREATPTGGRGPPSHVPSGFTPPIDRTRPVDRDRGGDDQRKKQATVSNLLGIPIPGLSDEQSDVLTTVLGVGIDAGATPEELLAAVEVGLVESNLKNLDYGDADSEGFRQERRSLYPNPRNVKASAKRLFEELKSDLGTQEAATPGLLAQAAQGSAHPERYDEREEEAKQLLSEFLQRNEKAQQSGVSLSSLSSGSAKPLPGPYAGSRRFVSKLVGQPVYGDKEPGHAGGGMHDPVNPMAYAQDINRPGGRPSEGEPAFSEQTVDEIVRNLRSQGADIPGPKQFSLGENWEGPVKGYDVKFLTAPHGSGPHLHIGAEYGEGNTGLTSSVSGSSVPGGTEKSGDTGLLNAALDSNKPEEPTSDKPSLSQIFKFLDAPTPSVRGPLKPLQPIKNDLLKLIMRRRT